jgi:hypothetical protein
MNVWYSCSETFYCSTVFLVVNLSIILTSISTQCSMWSYLLNWNLGYDLVLGLSRLFICWLQLSCSFLWFLIRRSNFLVVQLIVYIIGNANICSIEELGHQYGSIKVTFFCLAISNLHYCRVWLCVIIIDFGANLFKLFIMLWWTSICCFALFLIPQFPATSLGLVSLSKIFGFSFSSQKS